MKSLNLYLLCQVDDLTDFSDYENILSRRPEQMRVRDNEQYSLQMLTAGLTRGDLPLAACDGFFFSYTIDHIGKEFDLLKICRDRQAVLNIELKSEPVERWRIKKQLAQNRYYLRHISDAIESFTFEAVTGAVYRLDEEGELQNSSMEELTEVIRTFGEGMESGIEELFLAEDFLISPTGTPEKFLQGKYFLSPQQEYYREQILKRVRAAEETSQQTVFLAITGSSGTGKTLLLYDLALELAKEVPVCLIHGGQLAPGHRVLEEAIEGLRIGTGADWQKKLPEDGRAALILVDETQHLLQPAFDAILDYLRKCGGVGIFSFDEKKILSQVERQRGISEQVTDLAESTYRLSGKIRTNKSLASFLRVFLESKSNTDHYFYRNIDVIYARSDEESARFRDYYVDKGYHFVDIAACVAKQTGEEPVWEEDDGLAESVFGQDYDDVVIRVDEHFYYDEEGTLRTEANEDPNVIYDQLLFHGVTRTRNRLCVILEENPEVFRRLNRMIRNRY